MCQKTLERSKSQNEAAVSMGTCSGVKENENYRQVVDNQITMDALFED